MKKTYSLVLALLLMPSISYSAEHKVYFKDKVAGKDNMTVEYGISGSWITRCTRDQPYGKIESQSCELRLTNGVKWPSGIYQDAGPTPVIVIGFLHPYGEEKPRPNTVNVSVGYKVVVGTVATLTVGKKKFTWLKEHNGPNSGWNGEDAKQIIQLFIESNSAKYDYVARNGRQSGTASLRGFTSAWNYAVKFTGVNPFK